MIINSLENKDVKKYYKLKQKKYRDKYKMFLVEGYHLVEEAYNANLLEKVILLDDKILDFDTCYMCVTKEVMKKLSTLETPPNIIGVCKIPNHKAGNIGNKILLLDNVQDPGNLGTIIRSAKAFDVDSIVVSNDTVDLYNPKVVRATQGIIFHTNIFKTDLIEFVKELKSKDYKIYSTNVENGVELKEIITPNKYAIVMGNEGNGVRGDISSLADTNIYIKMNKKVESLNVAIATSIILYELEK